MERFDPFAGAGPRWFTIAAHRPFLDDLAAGVLAWRGDAPPEALAETTVLLPNRRAARLFAEALGRAAGGRPVLLPQVRPLGDIEAGEPPFAPGDLELDLKPAIGALRRRFELARIIKDTADVSPSRALELAEALARFLDSCRIEEVREPERVRDLVTADLAEHWQVSAAFLTLALDAWSARLERLGLMDAAERRATLLNRLADRWETEPPRGPVIAAGSTGTVPAAARVLAAAAAAPLGCVVLPGLDLDLAEPAWAQVEEQHPQGALKRLIEAHGIDRRAVRPWPADESPAAAMDGRARRRLIAEALKPPEATADWLGAVAAMRAEPGDAVTRGLRGLTSLSARTEEKAAALAAVLAREALETPGRTVAVVTPDRQFGRRVQARLARWGISADDSAGEPLALTPTGRLLGLAAGLEEDFSAARLLALLKHPLVGLGLEPRERAERREALERHGLRGPRPEGFAAVRRRLAQAREPREGAARAPETLGRIEAGEALLDGLETALAPLAGAAGVDGRARALALAVEALAGGAAEAWRGAEGEAAARLLGELIADGGAAPPLSAGDFAALLAELMQVEVVRTGAGHPRVRILGAIEARLARADRVILAGLEEGVWPPAAGTDPFLSRPMRKALGLPPPERRIGLSAHDFAQIACAPEVYLLHAERRGGQPAVKSRWLWRLETLVGGAGLTLPDRPEVAAWAAALDAPDLAPPPSLRPARRPAPTPPLDARPTALSVTRVEEWVRDPYATYARFILRLSRLDGPDEPVDARIRGAAIHAALQRFAETWPGDAERFADLYLDELRRAGMPEAAMAREAVLGRNAGAWAARWEAERRALGGRVLVERAARWDLPVDGEPFGLTVRADRLEAHEGLLTVIDFKTGGAPSKKQVQTGFAPQLPLTAAMARAGAFDGLGPVRPGALLYVAVTGREPPAKVEDRSGEDGAAALVDETLEGLARRVRQYRDPARPYASRTAPQFAQRAVSDYDRLARVAEWSVAAGDEE